MRRIGIGLLFVLILSAVTSCDREAERDEAAPASSTTTTTTTAGSTTGATSGAKASPGCTRSDPGVPAGRSERRTTVEGTERTYLLYVPTSAPPTPRPLVFNIHGHGSTANQQVAYSGVETVAEREDFVTVAPQGQGDPAAFDVIGMTDVTFVGQLIDEVGAAACIDLSRVYSMGMSNGGALSAAIGCRLADRFAAVAPVALVIYIAPFCDGTTPTPISTYMGTDDRVVPFDGGTIRCCGSPTIRPAPEIMADWAKHNGCDGEPATEQIGSDVEKRTWNACEGRAETVFYVVKGGGHTWPGARAISQLGKTTQDIDATETIWSFFAAHQRAD